MAEPARKLEDETEQPYLRSIKGGGNATPGRGDIHIYKPGENEEETNSPSKITDLAAARRAKELNNLENNSDAPKYDESVNDREESGANITNINTGGFVNNVQGKQDDADNKGSKFKAQNLVKQKGPLTAIILTLVGGGIGIGSLLSPSLLLVNLKEIMVNKFNVQLTSMDIRTKKIITSKVTSGACTTIKIACKFSSMSEKQITSLEKAGVKISYNEDANIIGRHQVTGIEYKGETISASDFASKLDADADFRLAVKKAYNPLFAGFYDKVWNKSLFYLNKDGFHLGGPETTDAEKLADIQDTTKEAVDIKESGVDVDVKDEAGDAVDEADVDTNSKSLINNIENGVDEVSSTSTKAITETADIAADVASDATAAASKVASVFSLTGWIDNACTAYGTVRAVGFAAKTVRAVQLASYAMLFFKVADMIKSGASPSSEDIAYLGTVLTTAVVSTKMVNGMKQTTRKTATDSFGYKYAAYGEVGTMPESATQFLTGSGFTGVLTGIPAYINSVLGNSPATTCKITQNVLFQIGSAVVSVAVGIATGGLSLEATFTVGTVASLVSGAALMIGLAMLPALLQDIIAGVVVDKTTVGELSGDAITSGASNMMGSLAKTGGNSPLTVDQAVAYSNLSKQVAQEYAAEDRIAYSPLDVTNSNTFMGNLVGKILPYITNVSSVSSALSSLSSFTTGSLASINNTTTKAASAEEYSLCQDLDYAAMGIAADPYCNIAYGIPTDDLNIEPTVVVKKLQDAGQLDEDGNIGSDFETFQNDCIYRKEPIGYTGSDFQADDGKKCLITNDSESLAKYYYLYTIDNRIDDGMSGDDEDLNAAMNSGLDSKVAFYDGSDGINNTTASNSFFAKIKEFFTNLFSKDDNDSSYNNQTLSKVTVI